MEEFTKDCVYFKKYSKYTIQERIERLPFSLDLIEQLYIGEFKFTEEDNIKLINQLKYLDSYRLMEVIVLYKFKYKNISLLKEDILKIYNEINMERTLLGTYLKMNMLQPIKVLIKNCKEFNIPDNKYKYKSKTNVFEEYPNLISDMFIYCCEYGLLEISQWLYQNCNSNLIEYKHYNCIKIASIRDHLHIIKWILTLQEIEYMGVLEICFILAVENNSIKTVQYLIKHTNLSLINEAILISCKNDNLIIFLFLISQIEFNEINLEYYFKTSFINDSLNIAQYISNLIDVHQIITNDLNENPKIMKFMNDQKLTCI